MHCNALLPASTLACPSKTAPRRCASPASASSHLGSLIRRPPLPRLAAMSGRSRRSTSTRAGPLDWLKSLAGGPSNPTTPDEDANEEQGTMRPLDGSGLEGPFTEQAVLLAGFMSQQEVAEFQAMMNDMGATMFRVIPATRGMLQGTLREALQVPEVPAYEQPPLGTRRTIVLSGMYDGEVIEVVSAYRESGLPPAVFAAAVPNNLDRQLAKLVREVHQEDASMQSMRQQEQQEL